MPKRLALLFCLPGIALAAHPLSSDDAGTQGAGAWQLELNADYLHEPETRTQQRFANLTLSTGLSDSFDLFVNGTALRSEAEAEGGNAAVARGAGDASLGAKWRWFENDDIALALKASANLPTGDAERGLGNGLPYYSGAAIVSVEVGEWTLMANAVGLYFTGDVDDQRKWQWALSTAAAYQLSDAWQLVGEVVAYSGDAPDSVGNAGLLTLGAIYRVLPTLDLDVGYRRGLMDSAVDHGLGAGLAFRW
ncbi:transporter [Niveibacterium sp. 24ML]|uniref:transporter n=1 Tax=Niveibacterium sp. 24ML TaxID=2985512 RepID=UPI00226D8B9D|nr:transporter [Niveibacterium sp. 24ML]MCX9157995.1 transporter [Niveibacterium sp. 24ML]